MAGFPSESEGWIEIGKRCSADRRSLWVRFLDAHENFLYEQWIDIVRIELRAGREGRDSIVVIDQSNPQWGALLDLFLTARFATQS